MITIALVDDHQLIRRGLRSLLEEEADLHVIGEAGDGLEAIQLVERLRPNVLVLDLMIPTFNGLEVTRQVVQQVPASGVIICSMHSDEAYVLDALRAGASAYILKESTPDELPRAIRAVAQGKHYLSPLLNEVAIMTYIEKAEMGLADPYETLTSRERQVLQLVAQGLTNGEVANRLMLSVRTVETHRAKLMRKLGLRTSTDLVRFALQRGLVLDPSSQRTPV